jgi:hypothetical protein
MPTSPVPPTGRRSRGRPRKLDEVKRGQICALLAAGSELRQAAQYVGCSPNTIRREAERYPKFRQQLQYARSRAPKREIPGVPAGFRSSIRYFERKDRLAGPREQSGVTMPGLAACGLAPIARSSPAVVRGSPDPALTPPQLSQDSCPSDDAVDDEAPATLADLAQVLRKLVNIRRASALAAASHPQPSPPQQPKSNPSTL